MIRRRTTPVLSAFALLGFLFAALNAGCSKGRNNNALLTTNSDGTAERIDPATVNNSAGTCELRLLSGTPHQGGTWARLAVSVGVNSGTKIKISDASNPSNFQIIDSINTAPRAVEVYPDQAKEKYLGETDSGATCSIEIDVTIPAGGIAGVSGSIVVLNATFVIPPPIVGPVPVFPFELTPICSTGRAAVLNGNNVAYDIYEGTQYSYSDRRNLYLVLSFESGGKPIFGRILPRDQHYLDRINGQLFRQPVPVSALDYVVNDRVEVRLCVKRILTGEFLTDSHFMCSVKTNTYAPESPSKWIGVGREEGTSTTYLEQRLAVFTRAQLLSATSVAGMKFWNKRGVEDGSTCINRYSPLVLDILGNGISTTDVEKKDVWFDMNATGEVLTGWVGGHDDAFLVRDLNGNSKVDNGRELFGSATRLSNGSLATNGFEALKDLDSNGDKKFSEADDDFSKVKLWFGSDYEMQETYTWKALQPLNNISLNGKNYKIAYIDLDYTDGLTENEYGNETRQRSRFRIVDAGEAVFRTIVDIWFRYF